MIKLDLPKLAAPAMRALATVKVGDLKQLTKFTEADISKLHGMGPNALTKLKAALMKQKLSFKK